MLEQLKLENWKCHSSINLEFKPGVNVIIGPMGSGKSSILQAISYALFGTFSELKSRDLKLKDLHKRPRSKLTKIDLTLKKHKTIKISRIIKDGKSAEATARSKDKLIAGTNPAQVNDYVASLIKVNEDTFLQTTYSKQNEIDLYLKLSPGERKQRIDDLMGLDKFEIARKSATKLKNKLQLKKESREDILKRSNLNHIVNQIVDAQAEIKKMDAQKHKSLTKLKILEDQKTELQLKLKKLDKQKQEATQLKERKNNLSSQLKELELKLKKHDLPNKKELLEEYATLQTKIKELQSSRAELREELENSQKKLLDLENKIGALENKHIEAKEALEKIKAIKTKLEALQKFGPIEAIQEKIRSLDKIAEREKAAIQSSKGAITTLEKHLKELKETKDSCPVCSSKLEQETKTRLINERESDISELKKFTQNKIIELNKIQDKLFQLKENQEEQKEIIAQTKDENEIMEREKEAIVLLSEAKGKKASLSETIDSLKTRITKSEKEVEQTQIKLQDLEKQKQLHEIKDKRDDIENQLIDINNLLSKIKFQPEIIEKTETDFHKTIQAIEKINVENNAMKDLIKEKLTRVRELKEQENTIKTIQEEIDIFLDKINFLHQFKSTLLVAQEALRKELTLAINEIMDSIWQRLYPYNTLNSIRLNATENDYVLEIRDDQEWLPVIGYASGGERTLAALAMRMAIAKVMAPNLSLLILDEPTHNLDREAIETLRTVLQENLSGFLDQIFVVTHEDKLAEAADHIIELKK